MQAHRRTTQFRTLFRSITMLKRSAVLVGVLALLSSSVLVCQPSTHPQSRSGHTWRRVRTALIISACLCAVGTAGAAVYVMLHSHHQGHDSNEQRTPLLPVADVFAGAQQPRGSTRRPRIVREMIHRSGRQLVAAACRHRNALAATAGGMVTLYGVWRRSAPPERIIHHGVKAPVLDSSPSHRSYGSTEDAGVMLGAAAGGAVAGYMARPYIDSYFLRKIG